MFSSRKIFSYLISITIAVVAIYLLQPSIEQYKKNKQYAFEVNSVDGLINNDTFKNHAFGIYFGYTYCPDVCPTSLSSLALALQNMPKEKTAQFKGLFISVDPNRDKIKALKEYAQYFHPSFTGATSNKENLDDITQRFGTFYKNVYLKDSKMDYSVSHTSYIYIFNKNGEFVEKIDHFSDPVYIQSVLEKIL